MNFFKKIICPLLLLTVSNYGLSHFSHPIEHELKKFNKKSFSSLPQCANPKSKQCQQLKKDLERFREAFIKPYISLTHQPYEGIPYFKEKINYACRQLNISIEQKELIINKAIHERFFRLNIKYDLQSYVKLIQEFAILSKEYPTLTFDNFIQDKINEQVYKEKQKLETSQKAIRNGVDKK
ncbi:MAG: hypothetical protein WDZ41_00685 [Candidatus Babeliales bacterium]